MIIIKHLQINDISELSKPLELEMLSYKPNQTIYIHPSIFDKNINIIYLIANK